MTFRSPLLVSLLVLASTTTLRAQDPAPAPEAPAAAEGSALVDGMRWLSDLLRVEVGENSFRQVLFAFGLLILAFFVRKAVLVFLFHRLRRLTSRTAWKYDDRVVGMMEGPVSAFVLAVGIFLAITVLSLPPEVDGFVLRAFQGTTLTIAFWGFLRFVDLLADALADAAREREMAVYHFLPLIKKAARVFLIVVGVILVIQNLGYSVGSLLTGLGIGGLAVALAAQESLSNFFGSVSIATDRPFKVGDWIHVAGKLEGTVEEVGLRSTKVRSFARSQLTIPNKILANEIIENWSRMPQRRVRHTVGVTYETSPEAMELLVEDVRAILRSDEGVHPDKIMVYFTEFGASSLDLLVNYFTIALDIESHLAVRQRINLAIMRAVAARGLSIAFPTRTLYFEGPIARAMAGRGDADGPPSGAA